MDLNLVNFTRADIIASVSALIATYSIYVNKKLHRENVNLKKQTEDAQKLKPYEDLAIQTYFNFKDIFNEVSSTACKAVDEICKYADICENGNRTNKMALRHHLYIIPEIFVENNKDDILWRSIEYMEDTRLGEIVRTSSLDLKNYRYDKRDIKSHLKILYENFDIAKKCEYCKIVKDKLANFHNIYHKNQEEINKSIVDLEQAISKFKLYDFVGMTSRCFEDLKELLNLLHYIKKCSISFSVSDGEYVFLSQLAANLSELMMINQGVLKISRLNA
jgi:hypothetical protein